MMAAETNNSASVEGQKIEENVAGPIASAPVESTSQPGNIEQPTGNSKKGEIAEEKNQTPLKTPRKAGRPRSKGPKTPNTAKRVSSPKPVSSKKKKRSSKVEAASDNDHKTGFGLLPHEVPLPCPPQNLPESLIGRRISLVWKMEDGKKEWWAGVVNRQNTNKNKKKQTTFAVCFEGDDGLERNAYFDPAFYSVDPDAKVGSWLAVSLSDDEIVAPQVEDTIPDNAEENHVNEKDDGTAAESAEHQNDDGPNESLNGLNAQSKEAEKVTVAKV
eukprot:CAMPEP_0171460600 /NCGR_PEP_ID=MMETSP0945-20130129/5399_1 /TAXON_ID=109269 /ORGANISM="Vaucheria litorea, Strain CCMP2940" /LENGTH=272 /DNA_ID=CAMNT_0011986811 /DNA_START=100 /DNA_END=918 /DNA_ORIENTATION=+